MKLLPEPGWLKTFVATTSSVLLTFFITSLLFVYLATECPEVILGINYEIRFAHLELSKKLIAKKTAGDVAVYLYVERFSDPSIQVLRLEYLESIAKEAMDDFPDFLFKRHQLFIPRENIPSIKIVLVSQKTYESRDKFRHSRTNAVTSWSWPKRIYIQVESSSFDIVTHKPTIRHEIFHWIAFSYNLERFMPSNHEDAKSFENLK